MPLELMKFMVDHFSGTSYAPYIDGGLLLMLAAGIFVTVRTMLGTDGRTLVRRFVKELVSFVPKNRGYAPEWERRLMRVRPYLNVFSFGSLAVIGLYGFLVGSLVLILASMAQNPTAMVLSALYCTGGAFYLRKNLIEVSWAWHSMKKLARQ